MLRKGDVVYVAKLDRAFRRAADCAVVMETWGRLGVSIVICDLLGMTVDLSSPIGRFIVLILAAVAQLEREFISERTKSSLARARWARRQATNQHAGYGYTWKKIYDPDRGKYVKTRVDDQDERNLMREIVRWKLDGHSWDDIYQHVNYTLRARTKTGKEWSMSRIRRVYEAQLEYMKEQP